MNNKEIFRKRYLEGQPALVKMRIVKITLEDKSQGYTDEVYFIQTDKPHRVIVSQIEGFKKHFDDAEHEYPYNWETYHNDMQTKIGKLVEFDEVIMDLY